MHSQLTRVVLKRLTPPTWPAELRRRDTNFAPLLTLAVNHEKRKISGILAAILSLFSVIAGYRNFVFFQRRKRDSKRISLTCFVLRRQQNIHAI